MIYNYCSEDRVICVRHSPTRRGHRRGDFSCLPQVCCQLRNEFRNLYLGKTTIKLCGPQDAIEYIVTFYDDNDSNIQRKYQGDIIVPIPIYDSSG